MGRSRREVYSAVAIAVCHFHLQKSAETYRLVKTEALNKTKGVTPRWLWRVKCNSGGLQVSMSSASSENAEIALGEVTASGLGGMVNGHAMHASRFRNETLLQ